MGQRVVVPRPSICLNLFELVQNVLIIGRKSKIQNSYFWSCPKIIGLKPFHCFDVLKVEGMLGLNYDFFTKELV